MSKTWKRLAAMAVLLLAAAGTAAATSLPDFTGIVEQNGPAVVNVQAVISQPEGSMPAGAQGMPPDFFRFFGIPMPRQQPGAGEEMSLGSGFIISTDGYILTNNHVVGRRQQGHGQAVGSPRLHGQGRRHRRRLPTSRVLKIDAKDLPTVSIGDSNHAQGRASGCWRSARPTAWSAYRHRRHRQRGRPQPCRDDQLTCPSSRPTCRSTAAIPAGRCSNRTARWSASTPRSSATAAATWACPSRSRSTSP